MVLTRALGTALAAVIATLALASSGAAAPVRPPSDETLTTAHFVIHYDTDTSASDYATQTQAGDVGAYAEQAYSLITSWGYPAPPDDGDGHIDIYLMDLSTPPPPEEAEALVDAPGVAPATGMIELAIPSQIQGFADAHTQSLAQEEEQVIAGTLFYLFEWRDWVPTNPSDWWIEEGASTWAGIQAIGAPNSAYASPDIALNCEDDLGPPHQMCDPETVSDGGWGRWAFFQLLATTYGNTFLRTVLANGAAGQSATTALSNALAAKGSSLASVYNEYALDLMDGGLAGASTVQPPVTAAVTTGVSTATLAPVTVFVNHLSARYVTFQRGDGDGSHACYAAKLSIAVNMPSGTSAQPYFFWDVPGSTPQALTVSGNTASITVPWDTCDWGSARGWLSIPNASTSVDAATFTVTSSVTVDPTTPASATTAPVPTPIWGTTVPVPTTDAAPDIQVYGPELLQVSAGDPSIRLIVESDGAGTLNAALGAASLGQRALRAGNNDLRFVVPKGLLGSLRSSAVAANLLTLTPLSPTGAVTGQAVTRQVVITVAKKKPAPKKPVAKTHKK